MAAKRLRDAVVVKKTTRQLATALFARTFFARIVSWRVQATGHQYKAIHSFKSYVAFHM